MYHLGDGVLPTVLEESGESLAIAGKIGESFSQPFAVSLAVDSEVGFGSVVPGDCLRLGSKESVEVRQPFIHQLRERPAIAVQKVDVSLDLADEVSGIPLMDFDVRSREDPSKVL